MNHLRFSDKLINSYFYFKPGFGKLQPVSHTQPMACFHNITLLEQRYPFISALSVTAFEGGALMTGLANRSRPCGLRSIK